ncbi:MAG TPA: phosphodiesterase [Clostridiaceae bacterium]|jgi:putative phosphoesterase|nr:phosphodiesterase [Clostridiaceae bacterium]
MKTLIISDTHGSLPEIETIFAREHTAEAPLDFVLHSGDVLYHGPRNPLPKGYTPADLARFFSELPVIRYVRGNCDSDVDQVVLESGEMPKEQFVRIGSRLIYLTHGEHTSEQQRVSRARSKGATIAVSGHTHASVLKRTDGVIVLNPGSTVMPKDGTASYALLTDDTIYLKSVSDGRILASIPLESAPN